jgi:hypothetical protein
MLHPDQPNAQIEISGERRNKFLLLDLENVPGR